MIATVLCMTLVVGAAMALTTVVSDKTINGSYPLGVFLLDAFITEQSSATSYSELNITSIGAKNDLSAAALLVFSDSSWPPANATNCRSIVKSARKAFSLTTISRQITAAGVFSVDFANAQGRDTTWYLLVSDCVASAMNKFYWTATFTTSK